MYKIRNSPHAEADMMGIWDRTVDRWGRDKADAYVKDIAKIIEKLAEFPELGVDVSWLSNGYRRLNAKHHVVYYKIINNEIEIVRVLHSRMDVDSQLDEET